MEKFLLLAEYIQNLPYRRNSNKEDIEIILKEKCGTCSTKHAFLKDFAEKEGLTEVKLILGIFKMSGENTTAVKEVLKKHHLSYLPEAHNYLKIQEKRYDFTSTTIDVNHFLPDILQEIEIETHQISTFKVAFHQKYLADWIEQEKIPMTLAEIWEIREQCIEAIG